MEPFERALFGSLAVTRRLLRHEQLEEALKEQAEAAKQGRRPPLLGEILVAKGYLTVEQIRSLLSGQGGKGQGLFGEIAVEWKLCPEEEVDAALAQQLEYRLQRRRPPRLGWLLVGRGALKPHQVHSILKTQGKMILQCPGCQTRYNALHVRAGAKISCPRCNTEFVPVRPATESTPDGEAVIDVRSDVTAFLPAVQTEEEKKRVSVRFLPPPDVTLAPYRLEARIGADGSGVLYRAVDPATQAFATVRLISAEAARGGQDFEVWRQAGAAAALLDHPNLQRVLAARLEAGRLFVVSEFHEGQSLRQLLQSAGKLAVPDALSVLTQCAEALAHGLSKQLLHGDLRPSHVIVSAGNAVHVSGLGMPKRILANLRLLVGHSAVPLYAAPEVLRDPDGVDARSDVYSLCALGYHMVTGRAPQIASLSHRGHLHSAPPTLLPPHAINPLMPTHLSRLLLKGLARHPGSRYASAVELLADLRTCQNGWRDGVQDIPAIAPEFDRGVPRHARSRLEGAPSASPPGGPRHRPRRRDHTEWLGREGYRLALASPPPSALGEAQPPGEAPRETAGPAPRSAAPIEQESRKALLVAAAVLVVGSVIVAVAWSQYRPPRAPVRGKDREAAAETEPRAPGVRPEALPVARELAESVTAYRLEHPKDHAEILRRLDRFLELNSAKYADTEAVRTAQAWRREHAQAGAAQARPALHGEVLKLLQEDRFGEALQQVAAWRARWGEEAAGLQAQVLQEQIRAEERAHAEAWLAQGRAKREEGDWAGARECFQRVREHLATEFAEQARREEALTVGAEERSKADQAAAAAQKKAAETAAPREAAAPVLLRKLLNDLQEPVTRFDFPAAWRVVAQAEPALAGTSQALAYQSVRAVLQRLEGLVDRVNVAARGGQLGDFKLRVKDRDSVIVEANRQGPMVAFGAVQARVAWSSLDPASLSEIFQRSTNMQRADEVLDLALLQLFFGRLAESQQLLKHTEELGGTVSRFRELAAELERAASSPAAKASPAEKGKALEEEAAVRQALKGTGWDISRGQWTVNPDGSLVGTPEPGMNLVSVRRELRRFRRVEVEFRGEGDAAGFSFGKAQRFMVRPSLTWQRLSLEVVQAEKLELRVDGEARASLEASKDVTADQLPDYVYLRGLGPRIEFRNFAVDGKLVLPPGVPEPKQGQDPKVVEALKLLGWEIAGGLWKIAEGTLSGEPDGSGKPVSLRRPFKNCVAVRAELRGDGAALGFSFGKGQRFLAAPGPDWQACALDLDRDGRIKLSVGGQPRASLEDTSAAKSGELGDALTVLSTTGRLEVRGFKME
jgi:serine/threonine-protein kinase